MDMLNDINVTLDHKISHKGPFLLGYDNIWLRYNYLKIWNLSVQKTKTNKSKYWENRL